MDPKNFPDLPSDIKAHGGFQDAHARSAEQILQAVQNELTTRNTENVLVVGHSLGGALALLDGVSLGQKLPSTTQLRVVTYGMPRVSTNHHRYQ
jgi:predicted lipase